MVVEQTQTPYSQVKNLDCTPITKGILHLTARGTFVNGHVLLVDWLVVK